MLKRNEAGFTLIEMFLVMAIVGIMAMLAIQGYEMSVARAKRVEATDILSSIWTAQTNFFATENRYTASFDELGFNIDGGVRNSETSQTGGRFTFAMSQPWGGNSWYATGTGNIDGDAWQDVLTMEAGRP